MLAAAGGSAEPGDEATSPSWGAQTQLPLGLYWQEAEPGLDPRHAGTSPGHLIAGLQGCRTHADPGLNGHPTLLIRGPSPGFFFFFSIIPIFIRVPGAWPLEVVQGACAGAAAPGGAAGT